MNKKPYYPMSIFLHNLKAGRLLALLCCIAIAGSFSNVQAQCDTEVSGVYTYCNSLGVASGYMVAFRVKDKTGTTLNVVDLTGQVPTNQGKRINDINTQVEPATVTVAPLVIGGGTDSLEFWYFGPFANNTPFNIVLVDPTNTCDTIFVASGTYDCTDGTGLSDPGACNANVPLYFLDFSMTVFDFGGGGGGNEDFDEIFLIMQRSREQTCCDLQPSSQRCFEFIVQLADQDIGLSIDDVGSGAPAGEFYADTLNAFSCTGSSPATWPFTQANGQSSDLPVCLTSSPGDRFVVLSCKSGNNVTGVSVDAISNIFSPPTATIEPCNVSLNVFGADSVMWSSPDDPTLANLQSCNGDSTMCMFFYDIATFGEVTSCEGDTFTYIVAALPSENECLNIDTVLMDTTYVVVYPTFNVEIDTMCNATGDSLIMTAVVTSLAIGCEYQFEWSTGENTQTITVPFSLTEFFVTVTRADLPSESSSCVLAVDSILVVGGVTINCESISDTLYSCISELPDADTTLVELVGCGINMALVYTHDISNGGSGCAGDSFVITRYYIVDFDGDTINTTTDRDTCAQDLIFVDDIAPVITSGCPLDVTVECASEVPAADPFVITATDNCTGNVAITSQDQTISETCENRFVIARTYIATDGCGNTATCVQTITVFDDTPPVLSCPPPITVECAFNIPPADINEVVGESDNCGSVPVITHVSDVTVDIVCANSFNVVRTYQATDACGNTATCTQMITVVDETSPILTCPDPVTVSCINQVPAPDVNSLIGESDNCQGIVTITHVSDVTTNFVCANNLTITRTYQATDECQNTATCTQLITVLDDVAPVIICPANVTVQCASLVPPADPNSLTGESDNCGGSPVIAHVSDITTNVTCDNRFTITRTYSATDECGNNSTCAQTITVFDNTPPTLTCPADVTLQCAAEVTPPAIEDVTVEADNCGGVPEIAFIGEITTSFVCENQFTLTRTYQATDDCGNTATCVQTITVFDNTPPEITCPDDITVQCAGEVPAPDTDSVIAEDDNCGDVPAVAFVSEVTMNQICDNRFTIVRTYSTTDACGNTGTCTQTITVFDDTAPELTCPETVNVQCAGEVPPVDINSIIVEDDNCGAVPVVIHLQDITTNQTCSDRFTVTRIYQVTDDCGNSSTCAQTINVFDDTPPTFDCPGDISVTCAFEIPDPSSLQGSDNCEGVVIITSNDEISNQICENNYVLTRTYTATDPCGNSSTCVQIITVADNTPPVLTCPANTTIQCTDMVPVPNPDEVTAESDNCEGAQEITFVSDVTINETCTNRLEIVRTYQATDDCGNSATCTQIITVFDDVAPTLTCPSDITVGCTSEIPPVSINDVTEVSDNCTAIPVVTHVADITTNQTCVNLLTITRIYQATDDCGNSSTCAQNITVFDNTAPSITCPANITLAECNAPVPDPDIASVTTSDACGTPVVVHGGDVVNTTGCIETTIRTYSVTDECGNSASCTQTITRTVDTTPPSITCPEDLIINAGEDDQPDNTGNPTVSDNCAGDPVVTFEDEIVQGQCEGEFTINRTFTATDACGNTATCLQVIEVEGSCEVDLSLTKDLDPGQGTISPGEDVNFTITVTNSGEVTIGSVTIIDYIPLGFSLNDPDWTPGTEGSTGQSASITLSIANGGLDPNGLETGESVSVQITLQANPDILPGAYVNRAEISVVFDVNGADVTNNDIDSDPDNDDTNDSPGEDDIDDALICILPLPVIEGDGFVCPDEITVYTIANYNPNNTYVWAIQNGGGVIIADDGQSITVEWGGDPGGAFVIQVTEIGGPGCQATAFFNVFIQGFQTLACNDHVNISIDEDCETVILSGMILEGEQMGDNNYIVIIIDEFGDTIPNATVTSEHVGRTFTVKVMSECNSQSCWGTITIEDKIRPTIECACPVEGVEITGFAGTLDAESATFIRPNTTAQGGTCVISGFDVPYVAFPFYLDVAGSSQFDVVTFTAPSDDSFLALYQDEFNPNAPCENLVAADDDSGPGFLSQIIATLEEDRTYILVFTTFNNNGDDFGDFEVAVTSNSSLFLIDPACQITCLDVAQLEAGIIPPDLLPEANDNCGAPEISILDVITDFDDCAGGTVLVTYQASDASGNTATCVQQFTIVPLTLDSLTFPVNYEGECGGSVDPEVTGWPQVGGINLTDNGGVCNIFAGYWDKELNECGGGRKIVRTWTVLDWCSLEIVEFTQIIKLTDTEAPVLTCPANITVGTDFWYCYANVSVPKPIAQDECSAITSYQLTSTGGTVVQFGNNFVINGLLIGTHTVTWTVKDECGNSSTCSFTITVEDDVVPVANCDHHTVVSLTNDGPQGITLVPATVFDDGSYDNCGPVTFRARRMDSCIDFDWTTEGACIDDVPGGIPAVNSRDRGTVHRPCVPFACCDVGAGPIMVELEVTDQAGNVNYCMVEVTVQDKIGPFLQCPPDIIISCDYWFHVEEGTFTDADGNHNGQLDEDPLSDLFGNIFDGFYYDESVRQSIVINDPGNDEVFQPHHWGIDGWADDNCDVNLQVRVRIIDDCSGDDLPANAPPGAVRLIERRFSAGDGNEGSAPGTCTQRIWVVDFDPFYITDNTCNNSNPNDGVIWPCDVVLTTCPDSISGTGEPVIIDDACSLIGVTYEDARFDFVDGACFKILREWKIIDWCQYNPVTGYGLWSYVQVIKVHDEDGPEFLDCPVSPKVMCIADDGVRLPASNQAFLGEEDPNASSCSVHVTIHHTVRELCGGVVKYDVKLYPFNGNEFIQLKSNATAVVGPDHLADLYFNTEESTIQSIRKDGLPYNSPWCGNYHRVLWTVEDGCGKWSSCEYLLRLEDCKQPSPVCINGISTVVMPSGGQVTVWAKDFDASSFDDCTSSDELLFSFSGDVYQPSFTYNCDNVPAFGVELSELIWVADGGVDHNCNGTIEWSERNKDYCTTTIVITDNANVCDTTGSVLEGEILTPKGVAVSNVTVSLKSGAGQYPPVVTGPNGRFKFNNLPSGQFYRIDAVRDDNHKNGVSTLDLVKIQKHLLGRELLTSPYEYIAADANGSQHISAIDLVELRKLILGIYTELPNSSSWVMVDKHFVFEQPEHPWPFNSSITIDTLTGDMHGMDFIGIKVGDVNNTVQANANQIVSRTTPQTMTINVIAAEEVNAGSTVDMILEIPQPVAGFQWTLETSGLELEDVYSEQIDINTGNVGQLHNGVVTMSWNGDIKADQSGEKIRIHLRWNALQQGKLNDMIRMTDKVTSAEAYTLTEDIMKVTMRFGDNVDVKEFALYQNQPNPWNGETVIGFTLPVAGDATLTVYDLYGKALKTIDGAYAAGYNSVTLTSRDLPSGVMYYRIESGAYSASKKMTIVR